MGRGRGGGIGARSLNFFNAKLFPEKYRRGREGVYLTLHCHHQNDSCIKIERHFNVSSTVRAKVPRQCPQTTTFEEKIDPNGMEPTPSAYRPNTLPLGQTGSLGGQ